MKFYVLTLFPEVILAGVNYSVIKRGIDNNLIQVECVNIRDFSGDKHNRVDDYPYGGGCGMVLRPQPVHAAYESINTGKNTRVVYMTPHGRPLDQRIAEDLSKEDELIILCGHYEGIDQRAIDEIVTDELSIGDYILTGGELPALVLIDTVSRLAPDVLGNCESILNESFSEGLLEYPQYTRPYEFMGKTVPDVLLSGHHKNIDKWRHEQSICITAKKRPDLLKAYTTKEECNMKGIITVLGKDQVGIIAKICTYLSNKGINILDISQTIVQGYFNMLMIVDITDKAFDLTELEALGGEIGVSVKFQHEDIFNSMHRIG